MCVRQAMIDDGKLELLQEMYASWPFFSVTLDMVEMVRLWPHDDYTSCFRCLHSLWGSLSLGCIV